MFMFVEVVVTVVSAIMRRQKLVVSRPVQREVCEYSIHLRYEVVNDRRSYVVGSVIVTLRWWLCAGQYSVDTYDC